MCPSKPDIPEAPPVPDPAPPLEETVTEIKRDTGSSTTTGETKKPSRKSANDLRVDINIPGVGTGLQV